MYRNTSTMLGTPSKSIILDEEDDDDMKPPPNKEEEEEEDDDDMKPSPKKKARCIEDDDEEEDDDMKPPPNKEEEEDDDMKPSPKKKARRIKDDDEEEITKKDRKDRILPNIIKKQRRRAMEEKDGRQIPIRKTTPNKVARFTTPFGSHTEKEFLLSATQEVWRLKPPALTPEEGEQLQSFLKSRREYTDVDDPHAVDVHDIVMDGGYCVQDDGTVCVCDGHCAAAVHKYRTLCCDDDDIAAFEAKWIPLIIRAGKNNQMMYLKAAIPAADQTV